MAKPKKKEDRARKGYGIRSVYVEDPIWAEVEAEVQTRTDEGSKWTKSGFVRDAIVRELKRSTRKRERDAKKS